MGKISKLKNAKSKYNPTLKENIIDRLYKPKFNSKIEINKNNFLNK